MNGIYLGEDGDARRSLPNISLMGSAIDFDQDSVENTVKDVEMEAELSEEECFEEDDKPLRRAEKFP